MFNPGSAFDALDVGETSTVLITYVLTEPGSSLSASPNGTLTITVQGTNDGPVGVTNTYSTNEDVTLVVNAASGVLTNDTDVDDKYGAKNTLTVNLPLVAQPTKGSVIMAADGSFVYTPAPNQNGTDTFVYQAKDDSGALSAFTTVTINWLRKRPTGCKSRYRIHEPEHFVDWFDCGQRTRKRHGPRKRSIDDHNRICRFNDRAIY